MLSAEEIDKILLTAYSKPRWWSDDPFTVMFQSVLVQNTAWSRVEKTCTPIGDKLIPEYIGSIRTESCPFSVNEYSTWGAAPINHMFRLSILTSDEIYRGDLEAFRS